MLFITSFIFFFSFPAVCRVQPLFLHYRSSRKVLVDDPRVGGNLYQRKNLLINCLQLVAIQQSLAAGFISMKRTERSSSFISVVFCAFIIFPRYCINGIEDSLSLFSLSELYVKEGMHLICSLFFI